MKVIKLILFFVFAAAALLAQQNTQNDSNFFELELIGKIAQLTEALDKSNELRALELIRVYDSSMKDEINQHRTAIQNQQYYKLWEYQLTQWKPIANALKEKKCTYQEFYEKNYQLLENYKWRVRWEIYEVVHEEKGKIRDSGSDGS